MVLAAASCSPSPERIDTESAAYRQAVNDFSVSLAASETDESRFAFNKMNDVARAFPQEAAAWANLGVLATRQGNAALARERFDQALQTYPGHPDILFLSADAESRFGGTAQAVAQLREALQALESAQWSAPTPPTPVRVTPAMLHMRLVRELDRLDPRAEAPAIRDHIRSLTSLEPENLAAWAERARVAVQQADLADLDLTLDALASRLDDPAALERLEQVSRLADGGETGRLPLALSVLRAAIEPTGRFQRDLARIELPVNQIGYLIPRFLRLPDPVRTVWPADTLLTFEARPLPPLASGESSIAVPVTLLESAPPFLIRVAPDRIVVDDTLSLPLPASAGHALPEPHRQLVLVDLRLEFRNSVAVAGPGGFGFFRQTQTQGFADETARLGLPARVIRQPYRGLWLFDLELDGDLDLLLSPVGAPLQVLRNNADGTVRHLDGDALGLASSAPASTSTSSPAAPAPMPTAGLPTDVRTVRVADLDGGSDPDLALLDGEGRLHLLLNRRGGGYRAAELPSALTSRRFEDVLVLDHTQDGRYDLLLLARDGELLRAEPPTSAGSMAVDPGSTRPPLPPREWTLTSLARLPEVEPGHGVRLLSADFDNNGALDLAVAGPEGTRILLTGPGAVLNAHPAATLPVAATAVFDADGDERVDLVSGEAVWANSTTAASPYGATSIRVRASGSDGDGRINSFGILGDVEVVSGPLYLKRQITDPIVHIGLGEAERAEMLRIIWPNGSVQTEFAELGLGSTIFNEQILKGSCPWLFTHDGDSLAFVTDVLWRSPLGLRINAMETAGVIQTLDRVIVEPDELRPLDGMYELRVTAELWETHFFDHVALHVLDHPAGTHASIDERFVFPAPDLSPKVHTPPAPIASVTTPEGVDLTPLTRARDGRHAQPFRKGPIQGVAQPHSILLELPARADELLLLLSGWLHPTDSSLNLLMSQGTLPRPSGLRVELWEPGIGWRVLHEDYGTPAGKDKTILLPIPAAQGTVALSTTRSSPSTTLSTPASTSSDPAAPPRRVRLTTTSEINWDAIEWALPVETPVQEYAARPALQELRHRGYSRWVQPDSASPLRPRYGMLEGTTPRWSDLEGYHTRFGDVRELLESIDDRYVIMNAGDEMLLRFEVPEPPGQSGWVRSFVFVSDGWVKDGDYNTEASRTVAPLPFHAMTDTDYADLPLTVGPPVEHPVLGRHAEDWSRFHTRYISPRGFRNALSSLRGDP